MCGGKADEQRRGDPAELDEASLREERERDGEDRPPDDDGHAFESDRHEVGDPGKRQQVERVGELVPLASVEPGDGRRRGADQHERDDRRPLRRLRELVRPCVEGECVRRRGRQEADGRDVAAVPLHPAAEPSKQDRLDPPGRDERGPVQRERRADRGESDPDREQEQRDLA